MVDKKEIDPAVLEQQQTKELEKINAKLIENAKLHDEIVKKIEEGNFNLNTEGELRLKQIDYVLQSNELKKQAYDKEIAILKINEDQNKERIEQIEGLKEELDSLTEVTKELREQEKLQVSIGKNQANSMASVLGLNKGQNTFLGQLIEVNRQGGSWLFTLKEASQQFANQINFGNILTSLYKTALDQTTKLIGELDKGFSDFEKRAGGVEIYKERILALRNANVSYAMTVEDSSKAYSELINKFSGFSSVSKEQQDVLATTTAQMDKLGFASSETIKIQNMLVKGFQMTATQAGDMQKQLAMTAKNMGLPMQKVVSEFANASNNMKAHGKDMERVFLDLQNQSRNTGIEFTRLQDITGKFDTFDEAAIATGKLNAILGGDYLNSIEMLNADEGERIRLMQESLQASGKSFDSMSKQERMAAAQALGLKDVTELQQLMNNEVEKGTVNTISKQKAEAEMAKSMENAAKMQEQWNAIMGQFATIALPVLEALKSILSKVSKFIEESPNFRTALSVIAGGLIAIGGAATVAAGIGGFMFAIKNGIGSLLETGKSIKDVTKSIFQKKDAISALKKEQEMAVNIQKTSSKAMDEAAKVQNKAADAVGNNAVANQKSGKSFADTLREIGKAANDNKGGLLAIGGAALMIGGGIAIAALGLAQLVKAFAGLGEAAWPAAAAVVGFTLAFGLMMFGLLSLVTGPQAVLTGAAIGVLLSIGGAALMIGASIGIAAAGVGYMAKNVAELFTALTKANPENIAKSFDALFDSLSLTRIAEFTSFSHAANGFAESLQDINTNLLKMIASIKILNALDMMFSGPKVNFSPATPTAAVASNTVSPQTTAAAATNLNTRTGGGSSESKLVPVAIYIDSKKIGEVLDPTVRQTIQDSLKKINGRMTPI